MTTHPSVTAHWRRLDRAGTDRCTLSRLDNGWMLVGHAAWDEGALDYCVRCGPEWATLSGDVTGTYRDAQIGLSIQRTPGGWSVNGTPQPEAEDHTDLDLGFTPATNLLHLRRLPRSLTAPVTAPAAWLVPEMTHLKTLSQIYSGTGSTVTYAAPSVGYAADLTVHPSGFVTHYPGLWEGWVDD